MKNNKTTAHQNLPNAAKLVFRRKFIALNAYIKNHESMKKNQRNRAQLKMLKNKQITQESRKRKIIMMRVKIYKLQTKTKYRIGKSNL